MPWETPGETEARTDQKHFLSGFSPQRCSQPAVPLPGPSTPRLPELQVPRGGRRDAGQRIWAGTPGAMHARAASIAAAAPAAGPQQGMLLMELRLFVPKPELGRGAPSHPPAPARPLLHPLRPSMQKLSCFLSFPGVPAAFIWELNPPETWGHGISGGPGEMGPSSPPSTQQCTSVPPDPPGAPVLGTAG